jgi:hypothetical protein
MRVDGYGIPGSAEMIFDRRAGRFVSRLHLGPATQTIGFDGKSAWFADATGFPAIQGNADQRSAILAWSALFAKALPARVQGSTVRYSGLSRPFTVTTDPNTGRIRSVVIPSGGSKEQITPSDYRELPDGLIVPYALRYSDDNGTWSGVVTRIDTNIVPDAATFAIPQKPHDARIAGEVTTVPFAAKPRLIVIPARIDNGPVMHFILDTGGQNILTPTALRRLHIRPVGAATVGGVGANVAPIRFAAIARVRVGKAEMRNQPFMILDFGKLLPGIDGILGAELLSRFAARIDYVHHTLQLSAHLHPQWITNARKAAFVFNGRIPQVTGTIDGIPAQLAIDTGDTGSLEVTSPYVRAHDLVKRLHARDLKRSNSGVGGSVKVLFGDVKVLRLGSFETQGVLASLAFASAGFDADPSIAAGVGEGVFRRCTLVLDYAHQQLYFAPRLKKGGS